jgi:sec-independent protein translocase protein TatB
MFDIAWSELLVIGIVALIVVGPKELPGLLRTIGKVLGAVRKQASEFRAQFDEAMRDTEFDKIKQDIEGLKSDAENTLRSAGQSIKDQFDDALGDPDRSAADAALGFDDDDAHDADGMPIGSGSDTQPGVMGSAAAAAAAAASTGEDAAKAPETPASSSAASAASAAASAASDGSQPADKLPAKAGA